MKCQVLLLLIIALTTVIGGKINFREIIEVQRLETSINNISVTEKTEIEYVINKNETYMFTIENEKYSYSFSSELENVLYILIDEDKEVYEQIANGKIFQNKEIVYANPYGNLTDSTKVKVSPIPIYTEFNSLETIKENKYFFIRPEKNSILYLDSFDRNSSIYMSSENFTTTILESDTKITGEFKEIIADNKLYLIKNRIYSTNSISNFKKYFYKSDISDKEEINVKDDEINFLYLKTNQRYNLNFKDNTMNKMIKLSTKTLDAKIKIHKEGEIKNIQLDEKNIYYKIDKTFKKNLYLEVENDAFIEFLSDFGTTSEIKEETSCENYKLGKEHYSLVIKIPKTQKDFVLKLMSDENLQFSLALGLSNENSYSYSSNLNEKIDINQKEIELHYSLYKNLKVSENEFITFALNFTKKDNQMINISYYQISDIDEILDEPISEDHCKEIISNLTEVLEVYIYTDIAKNPPDIGIPNYHHRRINLIEEINNINTSNRNYYEFAQDIQKILTTTRDLHFSVFLYNINNEIPFGAYQADLPFKFVIKKVNNETHKIFIEKTEYFSKYDNETQEFINSHLDIPLKSVNDTEIFEYIQNWSKFGSCKNVHSQFTYMMNQMHSFYLTKFPFDYYDLNNEYEFEDNQIIKIKYGISKPQDNLKIQALSDEFNNYFINIMQKYKFLIPPPLAEIEDNFLISKGLIKEKLKTDESSNNIKWDITISDSYNQAFKCRVDKTKQVNVIFQNTFYLDIQKYIGTILECIDLFYSNDYPIIIIESYNGGGFAIVYQILHELIQMRTVNRGKFAFKYNEKVFEYLNKTGTDIYFDNEECKPFESVNQFKKITDHYNYNGLSITHYRTNTFDFLSFIMREAMNNYRKKKFEDESTHLKKPTDIIIFTDAFSYSATSGFIKGAQNAGSAIIVGYYGNPTINGIELFDGSQALSSVVDLQPLDVYKNLLNLGYYINGVTFSESFDNTYKNQIKNEIPLEYSFGQVDERVNIYGSYSDDIYNEFIDEGLSIFDKYNNKKECNPNNKRLLLHNDTCQTIEGIDKAHGGYKCNDQGNWEETTCYPYYCDIGYYYARDNNCTEECHSDDMEAYFLYQKKDDAYTIKDNKTYYFYTVQRGDFYFVLESKEDFIDLYPRIVFINYIEQVNINKEKKIEGKNEVQLNIFALESDTHYINLRLNESYDITKSLSDRYIIMFKPSSEHVLYLNSLYELPNKNIRTAILSSDMTYKDIVNSNNKYFENYNGDLFPLEANISYIFEINYNEKNIDQIQIFMNPIEEKEIIDIQATKRNYLYLQKNKVYTLNINDNIGRAIKLSRKTRNSEIYIEDGNILNSTNLYYKIEENFIGGLTFNISNEDAFIEFIYQIPSVELDFEELEFKNITNKYNLIRIPKKYGSNNTNFAINGEFGYYSIFKGYSIQNYTYYTEVEEGNEIGLNNVSFVVKQPYDNIDLMEDEYYTILVVLYGGSLDIKINIGNNKSDVKPEKKGLPVWAIILIVVGALLLIALIVIIILICVGKKQISNKEIEEKLESLTEVPTL